MKERPILFSGPMIKALLDGRKTQTRRIVKPQPDPPGFDKFALRLLQKQCPYGSVGDNLWVREAFYCDHAFVGDYEKTANDGRVGRRVKPDRAACEAEWREMLYYGADGPMHEQGEWAEETPSLKPSIYMPRWASRITLELTDVRVERLNDITEEDAQAEGIRSVPLQEDERGCWWTGNVSAGQKLHGRTAQDAFAKLWDDINGARAPWPANPWVWTLSFCPSHVDQRVRK